MKLLRTLAALALLLAPATAFAQCNGIFPANTVCGNPSGTPNIPSAMSPSAFQGSANGTNGQIQYNNAGTLAGFTASGDATINTSTGAVAVSKTGGVAFGPFATATDAHNLIANFNSGTSASTLTYWRGDGTWSSLGPGVDTNIPATAVRTSNTSAGIGDCGNPIFLGGNVQFTMTVGPASGFSNNCLLRIFNIDVYSGPGTGRGKVMSINGITQHILYPGQWLGLRQCLAAVCGTTQWLPEQTLNSNFGQVWFPPVAPVFFINASLGSNANDGLAQGSGNAFSTLAYCAQATYQQMYDRTSGGVECRVAAGTAITEFINIFYPVPGSGIMQIKSDTGGTQFTWNCPTGNLCLQTGDYSGVGLTDINAVLSASSPGFVFGHQYGIVDVNTNVKVTGANGSITQAFSCDFNFHWNFNNGLTYNGVFQTLFAGCPGSTWNMNNAFNNTGTSTVGRFATASQHTRMDFQGNASFNNTGATISGVPTITGNGVISNATGTNMPGGTPVPASGGWYCGSGGAAPPISAPNSNGGWTINTTC